MRTFFKLCIGMIFVVMLTGCIGENYDFTPPTLNLSSDSNIISERLAEANINWRGAENNLIEKETKDILELGEKQQPIYFKAGEKVDLISEHADFMLESTSIAVWENDKSLDLEVNDKVEVYDVNDISFYLPKEKGEYVIEVNLQTDRGNAQYVGNIVIIE